MYLWEMFTQIKDIWYFFQPNTFYVSLKYIVMGKRRKK